MLHTGSVSLVRWFFCIRLYLGFFDTIRLFYNIKVVFAFMTLIPLFEYHLSALEKALEQAQLWPECIPDEQAFSSVQPFAIDTMTFNEWLAFVFIPKCRQLLASNETPPPMAIAPAAEMYLAHCPVTVLTRLQILDSLTQRTRNE